MRPSRDPNVPHPGQIFYGGYWQTREQIERRDAQKRKWAQTPEGRENRRLTAERARRARGAPVIGSPECRAKIAAARRKDLPLEELRALRAEGLSYEKIGRRYGVSHVTVMRRLRPLNA